jgi:hypothetical protein
MRALLGLLLVVATPAWAKPCELRFGARASHLPDGKIQIEAFVLNQSQQPIPIVLPERCPAGPVAFSGIRKGYDFYGTCQMGPCQTLVAEQRRIAAPGKNELGSVVFDPAATSCNKPVARGSYRVSYPKPQVPKGIAVCGTFSTSVRIGVTPAPATPAPPPPTKPPMKPKATCQNIQACGLACPNGGSFAVDENGCEICACAKDEGLSQ